MVKCIFAPCELIGALNREVVVTQVGLHRSKVVNLRLTPMLENLLSNPREEMPLLGSLSPGEGICFHADETRDVRWSQNYAPMVCQCRISTPAKSENSVWLGEPQRLQNWCALRTAEFPYNG